MALVETTARNRMLGMVVIESIVLTLLLVLFSCTVTAPVEVRQPGTSPRGLGRLLASTGVSMIGQRSAVLAWVAEQQEQEAAA